MPKTTKSGDAKQDEIPSTLQRSDEKAQRTFAKAQESNAPGNVLSALNRLPAGQTFQNVQEVAQALGMGTEQQRF